MRTTLPYFILTLGVLCWIFLFSGIAKWLKLPSFDRILNNILGDPNYTKNIIIIFVLILLLSILLFRLGRLKQT